MTDSNLSNYTPAIFVHDGTLVFYPACPGVVYMVSLADLASIDGADFSAVSEPVDLAEMVTTSRTMGDAEVDMPRVLYPLTAHPSVAPPAFVRAMTGLDADGAGDLADDFADALGAWADWCDERVGQADGERAPQPAKVASAATPCDTAAAESHEARCDRLGIPRDATDIDEGRYVTSYMVDGMRCTVTDLM